MADKADDAAVLVHLGDKIVAVRVTPQAIRSVTTRDHENLSLYHEMDVLRFK
jgi:hypothetical protein